MGNETPNKTRGHIILRDRLAENRTALANERTFLAYVRTALTLFIAGVTFVRFFGYALIEIIGWILIPAGILTMIKGMISFKRVKKRIKEEERSYNGQHH